MTHDEEKTLRLFLSWCVWQAEDCKLVDTLMTRFFKEFDTYKTIQPKLIEEAKTILNSK